MGRGVIAGREIFWPTRNEIYALDPKSGAQTRSPIKLKPLEGGANLAASQGRLIVAGYDGLILLGPGASPAPTSREPAESTAAPKTGRLSNRASRK
jgi:hypothetical protein